MPAPYANATQHVEGLESETSYLICLGVEDTQIIKNRQPKVSFIELTTPDITPPQLTAAVVNGSLQQDR